MDEELKGIVQRMIDAGESEENIALVIKSYKVKKKEETLSNDSKIPAEPSTENGVENKPVFNQIETTPRDFSALSEQPSKPLVESGEDNKDKFGIDRSGLIDFNKQVESQKHESEFQFLQRKSISDEKEKAQLGVIKTDIANNYEELKSLDEETVKKSIKDKVYKVTRDNGLAEKASLYFDKLKDDERVINTEVEPTNIPEQYQQVFNNINLQINKELLGEKAASEIEPDLVSKDKIYNDYVSYLGGKNDDAVADFKEGRYSKGDERGYNFYTNALDHQYRLLEVKFDSGKVDEETYAYVKGDLNKKYTGLIQSDKRFSEWANSLENIGFHEYANEVKSIEQRQQKLDADYEQSLKDVSDFSNPAKQQEAAGNIVLQNVVKPFFHGAAKFGVGVLASVARLSSLGKPADISREMNNAVDSFDELFKQDGSVYQMPTKLKGELIGEDGFDGEKIVPKVSEMIGGLLPLLTGAGEVELGLKGLGLGSKLSHKGGLFISTFLSAQNDHYQAFKQTQPTQDNETAMRYSLVSAAGSGLVMTINPLERFAKPTVNINSIASALSKKEVTKKAVSDIVKSQLENVRFIVTGDVVKNFTNASTNYLSGSDLSTATTIEEFGEEIIVGGIGFGLLGMGSLKSGNKIKRESLHLASSDIAGFELILKSEKIQDQYSSEKIDNIRSSVKAYKEFYDALPSKYSEKKKQDLSSALVEKRELEKIKATKSKLPKELVVEDIKEIEKEQEILDNEVIAIVEGLEDKGGKVTVKEDGMENEVSVLEMEESMKDPDFIAAVAEGKVNINIENNPELGNKLKDKVDEHNGVKPTQKTSEVERLRQEEQAELLEAIPNAEKYLTDGKVDKEKITNPEDIAEFEKIYDKYDKVISPLLKPTQKTSEVESKVEEVKKPKKPAYKQEEVEETTDAKKYSSAMAVAMEGRKEESMQVDLVDEKGAQQILDDGGKIFMTKDGKSGGYVTKDGYMGGLFKDPTAGRSEAAKVLQAARTQAGGKFTDAYTTNPETGKGTKLEATYIENGFKPVARIPFNEEYAKEGWKETTLKHKPDVVFFAYDPAGKQKEGDGVVMDDYDAAKVLAKNYKTDSDGRALDKKQPPQLNAATLIEEYKGDKIPENSIKKAIGKFQGNLEAGMNKNDATKSALKEMQSTEWYQDQSTKKQDAFNQDFKTALGAEVKVGEKVKVENPFVKRRARTDLKNKIRDMARGAKAASKAVKGEMRKVQDEITDYFEARTAGLNVTKATRDVIDNKIKSATRRNIGTKFAEIDAIANKYIEKARVSKIKQIKDYVKSRKTILKKKGKRMVGKVPIPVQIYFQKYNTSTLDGLSKQEADAVYEGLQDMIARGVQTNKAIERARAAQSRRGKAESFEAIKKEEATKISGEGKTNKGETKESTPREEYDRLGKEYDELLKGHNKASLSHIVESKKKYNERLDKEGVLEDEVADKRTDIIIKEGVLIREKGTEADKAEVRELWDSYNELNYGGGGIKKINEAFKKVTDKHFEIGDRIRGEGRVEGVENKSKTKASGEEAILEALAEGDVAIIIEGQLIESRSAFKDLMRDNSDANLEGVSVYETKSKAISKYNRENSSPWKRWINPVSAKANLANNLIPLIYGSMPMRVLVKKLTSSVDHAYFLMNEGRITKTKEYKRRTGDIFSKNRGKISNGFAKFTGTKSAYATTRLGNYAEVLPPHKGFTTPITNSMLVHWFTLSRTELGLRKLKDAKVDLDIINEYMALEKNADLKEYADYLLNEFYPSLKSEYETMYEYLTGTAFPDGIFIPTFSEKTATETIDAESIMDKNFNVNYSKPVAGSLKQRVENKNMINLTLGAHEVALNYISTMERSKHFIPVGEMVNDIFNKASSAEMIEKIGNDQFNSIVDHLSIVITGVNPMKSKSDKFQKQIDAVMGLQVFGALAFKLASIPKQLTSFTHYAVADPDVSVLQWVAGFAPKSKNEMAVVAKIATSNFVIDRMKGRSIDIEANKLMNRNSLSTSKRLLKGTVRASMGAITIGDIGGVTIGGIPFAIAAYRKGINNGMTHDQAYEAAYEKFVTASSKAQQSTRDSETSHMQRHPVGRMFSAFTTSQTQTTNKLIESFKTLTSKSDLTAKETRDHMGKVVYYSVANVLFAAVANGFIREAYKAMFTDEGDEDDFNKGLYDTAMDNVQSTLNGVGMSGVILNLMISEARDDEWKNSIPIMQKLREIGRGGPATIDWMRGEKDWDYMTDAEKKAVWGTLPINSLIKMRNNIIKASEGEKGFWEALMNWNTKKEREEFRPKNDMIYKAVFDMEYYYNDLSPLEKKLHRLNNKPAQKEMDNKWK
tara:strand:+ start:1146 stop:8096 length:6951 start_codon:yes stop_codon:yes gene_type:complete